MECMENSLYFLIKEIKNETLTWDWVCKSTIAIDMVSGMEYLYNAHNILHHDLKPNNVLIDQNINAKLADFGLSVVIGPNLIYGMDGNMKYLSPERCSIDGYVPSISSEIYSLGTILWEMGSLKKIFAGQTPEPDLMTIRHWLMKGEQEDIPKDWPENWRMLIGCWLLEIRTH
jgi:serine/threonine protein kinase